jgi:uncharacterized repeat protein (TIGR02543 family)
MKTLRILGVAVAVLLLSGAAGAQSQTVVQTMDYTYDGWSQGVWFGVPNYPPNEDIHLDCSPYYRTNTEDWCWQHDLTAARPAGALGIQSATLTITAWDVGSLAEGEDHVIYIGGGVYYSDIFGAWFYDRTGILLGLLDSYYDAPVSVPWPATGQRVDYASRFSRTTFTLPASALDTLWNSDKLTFWIDIDQSDPNGNRVTLIDSTVSVEYITSGPPAGTTRLLTTASMPGGRVGTPGEGVFPYDRGTTVEVVAMPDDGYQFAGWTGTAVQAGRVAHPESASITLTMDADYTLTANFERVGGSRQYTVTLSAGTGGYVSQPGAGQFTYDAGTTVPIIARAYAGYSFSRWTGTAVNAGAVASPTSVSTTLTVDGDYSLQADFVRASESSVEVLAPNGGESLLAGGTIAIRWQTQGQIANVSIDLTTDGGATWTHVSSPTAGAGSYDWPVPQVDADRCLVRVSALDDAAVADVSDAFFSIHTSPGRIWYVDAAAAPGGDGTSWKTAFVYLQDGLARAADGDSVWVAQGLYWPDLGSGQAVGDRDATFRLQKGVAICGGFPTGGGTWTQRNPFLHQSILTGDIGKSNAATDNTYHVVTGSGTDWTAILDGCTITGGFASGVEPQDRGAGLYNLWGGPQIRNCLFVANTAAGNGGGACNVESKATFVNCVFTGNSAGNCGGGVYSEQGNVALTNCTFAANQSLGRAGGVFNASGSMTVANSILWGNGRIGGESYDELAQVSGDSQPALHYCCIQNWTGALGGEGNFGRDPLFVDPAGLDKLPGTSDDDLRLQAGSRCIDAGDNAVLPAEITTDQQGHPRITGTAVDLGAYEYSGN